jgi:hypothetical protein
MSASHIPSIKPDSGQENHPIVLCLVTSQGHLLGKSELQRVNMAPSGTRLGSSVTSQLPQEFSDLLEDILITIDAEGLVPVWTTDQMELEIGTAILLSSKQPLGVPYELRILVHSKTGDTNVSKAGGAEPVSGVTETAQSILDDLMPPVSITTPAPITPPVSTATPLPALLPDSSVAMPLVAHQPESSQRPESQGTPEEKDKISDPLSTISSPRSTEEDIS